MWTMNIAMFTSRGCFLRTGTLSDLWSLSFVLFLRNCWAHWSRPLSGSAVWRTWLCTGVHSENNWMTGRVTLGHLCTISGPPGGQAGVMNRGQGQRQHRWDGNRSPPLESASLACSYKRIRACLREFQVTEKGCILRNQEACCHLIYHTCLRAT